MPAGTRAVRRQPTPGVIYGGTVTDPSFADANRQFRGTRSACVATRACLSGVARILLRSQHLLESTSCCCWGRAVIRAAILIPRRIIVRDVEARQCVKAATQLLVSAARPDVCTFRDGRQDVAVSETRIGTRSSIRADRIQDSLKLTILWSQSYFPDIFRTMFTESFPPLPFVKYSAQRSNGRSTMFMHHYFSLLTLKVRKLEDEVSWF